MKVSVNAEQQHEHHLHDENRHHGHEQEEKVSPVNQQDHSKHVHDENCDHDHAHEHAATAVPKDSTSPDASQPKEPSSNQQHNHQHSHSHSHSHGHPPSKPPPKYTPLMESIRDTDHDTFRILLSDPSVDINHFQTDWPICALFFTFVQRKYDFTEELIRNGVDVKATSADGISALKLALKTIKDVEVQFKLVTMLVDNGAVVEADLQEDYDKLMKEREGGGANTKMEEEGGREEGIAKGEL